MYRMRLVAIKLNFSTNTPKRILDIVPEDRRKGEEYTKFKRYYFSIIGFFIFLHFWGLIILSVILFSKMYWP
jgi:hypothetical protein